MPTTRSSVSTKLLSDICRQEFYRQLTEDSWGEMFGHYHVPDTRSRWQKLKYAAYWRTIGRFKAWLHRDCGEY